MLKNQKHEDDIKRRGIETGNEPRESVTVQCSFADAWIGGALGPIERIAQRLLSHECSNTILELTELFLSTISLETCSFI